MDAFVGIDVACAKGKVLPVSVCIRREGTLEPLPLKSMKPCPPRGRGNAMTLEPGVVQEFAESTVEYLRKVEGVFGITIRRIAIDAPSSPKTDGALRREAERGLDAKKIRCFTTPDAREFNDIRAKAQRHLADGCHVASVPHANQLWMLVGFELFLRLRQDWECIEVYPQAISAALGSAGVHKSKADGLIRQLLAAAQFTGWPRTVSTAGLHGIGFGSLHDKLDAYLAAWVASLDEGQREPIGCAPDDVIWVPKV